MGSFLSLQAAEEGWKSDARYSMETGCFCVLCGGPFDMEGEVYNIDQKEKSYQVRLITLCLVLTELSNTYSWLFNFRLLGSPSYVLNHKVTSEEI